MQLEARAANCCSTTHLLKVDGRPLGTFEGRWFSENLDISLTGRLRFVFRKVGWLTNQFELVDADNNSILASCQPSGLFTSSWDLQLSFGPAQLVRPGWFDPSFEVQTDTRAIARVNRLGFCERGWLVEAGDGLEAADLLLVGLLFHVIQLRRSRQQHAAGGHASGS